MNPRLRPVVMMIAICLLLFGISGRWTDPWLWSYFALWATMMGFAVASIDDGLAKERFAPTQPGADRVALILIRLTALCYLVFGALDLGRWQLFLVPTPLRLVGFAGYALFGTLVFRSMAANRFFSAVVRIQSDRGHQVIDQGPYSVVRHPGYAGMILAIPFSSLALGSWLAVAFALIASAMLLRRVVFEDAFLRANLKGYQDYLTRVPYRLVPGVW